MPHTRSRKRAPHRALRREAPSTVAVLTRPADFALMRGYRSFTFDDHTTYLHHTEQVLRRLAGEGVHTRVALFDPLDFGHFCAREHLDPDTAASRTRYVAEVAVAGTTVRYTGQPISELVHRLSDARSHGFARDRAVEVLAAAGECAACGAEIGQRALDRAAQAVARLLRAAGPGTHHLVASVGLPGPPLVTALEARTDGPDRIRVPESAALALATVLAAGLATDSPGGLVMRTERPGLRDAVRGWGLHDHWLRPLTAAEVFAAYCTDPATGEPVPPEPGVDHLPGHALPHPGGPLHC